MLSILLLLLTSVNAVQHQPRWYDDNGLRIRENRTQPQPGDGSGAEAWLPPLLDPKLSDDDTYSADQLNPHAHHELHYLDYDSSRAGHALLNLTRNAVKLEDASFVRKGSVTCSPYVYDRNYTLPFNATFQVDTHDQFEAILAWPDDTIVILWGPKSSGCPEYRHPYYLLSAPYDDSDGSCEKVTLSLQRAHWQDLYNSADVRLAPLANFNNSEFGDCTDKSWKRDFNRREFDYESSGGQTFSSTISVPLYNNDGLTINGYASLDGPYTTDARFKLDVGFSGTTGSLNFMGTANGLTASLGVDIKDQQQQFYSDSLQILSPWYSIEIAGIGIPELLILGITGNLDLEYRLTMSEYWGINDLGPIFTWSDEAQVNLAVGYDGNYYGQVYGNNWKPDTTFKPVFIGPTVALNAFAGPAIGLCAGLNTLEGFFNEQYCIKGALGFTASIVENGGSCTNDAYDFTFGIGTDWSYSGPWVGTNTIWKDNFGNLFDYCIPNPDGPVTVRALPTGGAQ